MYYSILQDDTWSVQHQVNKLLVGGLFCDFTKAFDCVKHDILLTKLEYYVISCKASDVIKSYLIDRYQRIIIQNEYSKNNSDWDKVKQGVPQGSILGPLFFLLYINDLPYIIYDISEPTLFADNASIIFYNSDSTVYATEFIMTFDKINLRFAISSLSLNLIKPIMCTLQQNQIQKLK